MARGRHGRGQRRAQRLAPLLEQLPHEDAEVAPLGAAATGERAVGAPFEFEHGRDDLGPRPEDLGPDVAHEARPVERLHLHGEAAVLGVAGRRGDALRQFLLHQQHAARRQLRQRAQQAPRGWEVALSGGLKSEIAAIGTEEALPYFDLRVSGTASEAGWVQVFLEGAKGIAAAPGATQSLMVSTKLAGGSLPEGAQAKLGFNFYSLRADGVDFLDMQRDAFDVTAGRSTLAFTFPDQAEIGACRPFIYLHGMAAGAAVEFTLRIGPARLIAGTEEPALAPFAGGSATDMPIEVGGPGFIPGFTEQMEGLSVGDSRDIQVVFPLDYGSAELAGKRAVFSITAKKLQQRVPRAIDDELAKTVGQNDLAGLQAQVKEGLQREYDGMARMRLKRALLDKLADQASFPVPEGMVEGEFSQIWQRVEADLKAGRLDSDDAGKDEATLRDEYRGIAQRRIRLGLLLSEIGRSNNIQVTPDELSRALRQEAARYRGQEQQVIDFFRKNPEAMENLRAPIFEEKVVDFILELAKVAERQVKPEELSEA